MATLTASFTATGAGAAISMKHLEYMDYAVSGTFVGTVQLQKSVTAGASWEVVLSATGAVSDNIKVENKSQGTTLYRWVCSAFTSGTIVTTLADNSATVLAVWKNSEDTVVAQVTEAGFVGNLVGNVTGSVTGSVSSVAATDGTAAAPSISFASDPDVGFYRVSANTLGFAAGGVEHARLSTSAFSVVGDIQAGVPSATSGSLIAATAAGANTLSMGMVSSTEARIVASGASNMTFYTDGNENMKISPTGLITTLQSVGIGGAVFGAGAAKVLALATGTAPSTGPADTVQLFSVDLSADNTIPGIFCEGTGVVGAGITDTTVTTKVAIKVNGTVYYLLATTVGT